jgi:hypothetical protein
MLCGMYYRTRVFSKSPLKLLSKLGMREQLGDPNRETALSCRVPSGRQLSLLAVGPVHLAGMVPKFRDEAHCQSGPEGA